MEDKSGKILAVVIIGIIMLIPLWLFIRFQSREVYVKTSRGELISSSGVVYSTDIKPSSLPESSMEPEKLIGRIKGEKFYQLLGGTSIWKVKGYDEQDVIYERALMWEAVYRRKDNSKTEIVQKEDPSLYKRRLHYLRHDYKEVLSLVMEFGRGLKGELTPKSILYVLDEKAVTELIDELTFNFNKFPSEKTTELKNILTTWLKGDYTYVNEDLKKIKAELKDVEEGKIQNYGLNGRQTSEVFVMMEAIAYSHEASLRDKKNPPYNTFSEAEFGRMEDNIRNHSNLTVEQRNAMLQMLEEWKSGNISNAVQQHKQLITWLRNDRLILK